MSSRKKKRNEKQQEQDSGSKKALTDPWISMRKGLIIMTITSIGMAVLTAIQVIPQRGWLEGILWALLFGVLVWVVFWGFYFFRRIFR